MEDNNKIGAEPLLPNAEYSNIVDWIKHFFNLVPIDPITRKPAVHKFVDENHTDKVTFAPTMQENNKNFMYAVHLRHSHFVLDFDDGADSWNFFWNSFYNYSYKDFCNLVVKTKKGYHAYIPRNYYKQIETKITLDKTLREKDIELKYGNLLITGVYSTREYKEGSNDKTFFTYKPIYFNPKIPINFSINLVYNTEYFPFASKVLFMALYYCKSYGRKRALFWVAGALLNCPKEAEKDENIYNVMCFIAPTLEKKEILRILNDAKKYSKKECYKTLDSAFSPLQGDGSPSYNKYFNTKTGKISDQSFRSFVASLPELQTCVQDSWFGRILYGSKPITDKIILEMLQVIGTQHGLGSKLTKNNLYEIIEGSTLSEKKIVNSCAMFFAKKIGIPDSYKEPCKIETEGREFSVNVVFGNFFDKYGVLQTNSKLFNENTKGLASQEYDELGYIDYSIFSFLKAILAKVFCFKIVYQQMIILANSTSSQGGEGKSLFFKKLLFESSDFFLDKNPYDINHKDFLANLQGIILYEMAEMVGAHNFSALKAMLTSTTDSYRAAYDRLPKSVERTAIIVGTYNGSKPLRGGATGLRRFLPIMVETIDLKKFTKDLPFLYSIAWNCLLDDYKHYLDEEDDSDSMLLTPQGNKECKKIHSAYNLSLIQANRDTSKIEKVVNKLTEEKKIETAISTGGVLDIKISYREILDYIEDERIKISSSLNETDLDMHMSILGYSFFNCPDNSRYYVKNKNNQIIN